MLQEPAGSARWYVVQKTGIVYQFDNQPNVATRREFINVSSLIATDPNDPSDERGLLGMAFHPDYPANPRVYLSYTANAGGLVSRVVEFQTRDGGQTLDPSSAVTILQTYQPEANHNGGNIVFGPDGYLYVGLGDGGGGGDQHGTIGNGQRLSTLLGKLLRIDVNGTTGSARYAIPAGNPYAGNPLCTGDTGAFTQSCPKSMPTDSAIPGAGVLTAAAASSGWATWGRTHGKRSIASWPEAITGGAAAKAPMHTTQAAEQIQAAPSSPLLNTAMRREFRLPAAMFTAAARFRLWWVAMCLVISVPVASGMWRGKLRRLCRSPRASTAD